MRQTNTLIHLTLAILFIVLTNACERSKDKLLGQYLSYTANVDKGSIFVYRDSITGLIDTFLVSENKGIENLIANTSSQESDPYIIQTMTYTMISKPSITDSFNWDIRITASASAHSTFASISYTQSNPILTYVDHFARIYSEPFVTTEKSISYKDVQLAKGQFPSYDLHGKTYATVFENFHYIHYDSILNKANSETLTFFSMDSGLIKFSIRTDNLYSVKELIYSNIKRKYPL